MATPIKRIEKDFILKVLYDECIPIVYVNNRVEYTLTMVKVPARDELFLKANHPIEDLTVRDKMELLFDFRGQVVTFTTEVTAIWEDIITVYAPEFLYKNLVRSFLRVPFPHDLWVRFTFLGDFYSLPYVRVNTTYETMNVSGTIQGVDPNDLKGVIEQMALWIKPYVSEHKLVLFKDVKPASKEEIIVARTGKCLYLPSTEGGFPKTDPYPQSRLITEGMFINYLERTGVEAALVHGACIQFVKSKYRKGISSDLWVPVLFQGYVIGYIHGWVNTDSNLPALDYKVIDTLYQYGAVLAESLRINGFFESGKQKNAPFEGEILDISASGLLFVYPPNPATPALLPLLPDCELEIKLVTPPRTVSAKAKIVRRFKKRNQGYFGARFLDMAPEDVRYLFEFIYGKPFTDDVKFLVNHV